MLNRPKSLLLAMAFIMSLVFAVWQALLNNFVIERAQFTGAEIGILQSLREVPGFLAFTAVFVLLIIKEQRFALVSLAILSIGVALTGFFPSVYGLYFTTVLMSIGFHYYETINQSLSLQWIEKSKTAAYFGELMAWKAAAALLGYASIWLLMTYLELDYQWVYGLVGGLGLMMTLGLAWYYPQYNLSAPQHKTIIFRKRYGLYYLLTFFSGARRQIFVVFAGFLMVEKFGYSVSQITALFLINYVVNLFFAPALGRIIGRIGERRALLFEYIGLIIIFASYAVVENAQFAALLYVLDHLFFGFAIAMKTYFQKIAEERDIASTMSLSFTINHIAAVVIPAILGLVWLVSPAWVFMIGSLFACCSLGLAYLVPEQPKIGQEVQWPRIKREIELEK